MISSWLIALGSPGLAADAGKRQFDVPAADATEALSPSARAKDASPIMNTGAWRLGRIDDPIIDTPP